MRVLVACEFSGVVRNAFRSRGHDAWSVDLLHSEDFGGAAYHQQMDVVSFINRSQELFPGHWDLMIAHPPCTYLANSGVQHLHKDPTRWEKLKHARDFFMFLWNAPIARIAVENPLPHRYAKLPKYSQVIQPYFFGDPQMKKTCLWLKNLPPLMSTMITDQGEKYITKEGKSNGSKWYQLPPSGDRWKHRSRTFPGIAEAMAEQWGSLGALEKCG